MVPEVTGFATGSLYWDDGEVIGKCRDIIFKIKSISPINKLNFLSDPIENDQYGLLLFSASENSFESSVEHWTTGDVPNIEGIKILGVTSSVTSVTVEGQSSVGYVWDGIVSNPSITPTPLNRHPLRLVVYVYSPSTKPSSLQRNHVQILIILHFLF